MHELDGGDRDLPLFFRVGDFLVRPTLKSVRPFRGFEGVSSIAEDHKLTDKAMAVLLFLADRPRELCSRDLLLDTVWGEDREAYDRVLDTAISEIRRAFGDDPRRPRYVQTIPRQGYRLIAEVERPEVAPPGRQPVDPVSAEDADGAARVVRDAPSGEGVSIASPDAASRPADRRAEADPDRDAASPRSRRLALAVALVGLAALLAFGGWSTTVDDELRIVIDAPRIGSGLLDAEDFSRQLASALDLAAVCPTELRRRRLSLLARYRLSSSLRQTEAGGLRLSLDLQPRNGRSVEVVRRSGSGARIDALVDAAADELVREIDREICGSGRPRGADRSCHCLAAGGASIARRQWREARESLEMALELAPDDWRTYDRLANLDNILGDDEAALEWLDRGLANAVDEPLAEQRLLRRRAQVTGSFREEERLLHALEAELPDNRSIALAVGWFEAMHRRHCMSSLSRFDDAIAQDREGVPYGYIGFTFLVCGELARALTAFERYVDLEPDTVDAYDGLATAHRLAGQYELARGAIAEALKVERSFPPIFLERAELALATDSLSLARQTYLAYRRQFDWPNARAEAAVGLARVAWRMGDREEAAAQAEAALAVADDKVPALWILGLIAIADGDLATATATADRIRALRGDQGTQWQMEYHHHLASRIARAEGSDVEALQHLFDALTVNPLDRAIYHAEIAALHRSVGRDTDAEAAFHDALAINPAHRPSLCGLAALEAASGRSDAALERLDRAAVYLRDAQGVDAEACVALRRRLQVDAYRRPDGIS